MKRRSRTVRWDKGAAIAVLLLLGCERAPSPLSTSADTKLSAAVTPSVAQSIAPDGTLLLDPPESPDGSPMISELRARQLAAAYLRTFGVFHLRAWEKDRGAPISLAALTVAPRAYFATTPYEAVPPGLHPSARKLYGPYYIVALLENGVPAVLLAVSAYNTDEEITANGQLNLPSLDGNAFMNSGIPTGLSNIEALSPEDAVLRGAAAGKTKVAKVPKLIRPNAHVMPIFALWKLTLQDSVAVRRHGNSEKRREIYVGRVGERDFRVPSDADPTEEEATTETVDAKGRVGAEIRYKVRRRQGYATTYEPVELPPEAF